MIPKPKKTKKKTVKTPIPIGAKECFACGCTHNLEIHHAFGSSNRNLSSEYKCVDWLCNVHHRSNLGVHGGNTELDLQLKRKHQERLESEGMKRKHFILLFGRSYL